jgi:hypothetical protein
MQGGTLMRPTGNVHSVPLSDRKATAPAGSDHYQRGGIIAAIVVALALFLAAWAINGYFTARTVAGLGGWLRVAWLSWGSGWCLHLAISVIEQHACILDPMNGSYASSVKRLVQRNCCRIRTWRS